MKGPMTQVANLEHWIDELRDRLERGDLDGLAPLELGYGTRHFPAAHIVRILLLDWADLEDPAGSWGGDTARRAERRHALLDDFRQLRELIG